MNTAESGDAASRGNRRRWVWPVVAAVAAAVLAAHAGTWFYVSGRILEGLPAFTAQAAREGWTIASGPPVRAGWPIEARVRVPAVVATRQLGGTRLVWTVDHVDLAIRPGQAGTLHVVPAGPSTLQVGTGAPTPLRAADAELLVPLDGQGPTSLRLQDFAIGTASAGLTVGRVEARIEPGVVGGTAGPIQAAPALPAPFDSGATLVARLVASPPIPLAATPGRSAAAWQAAGGRVALPELSLAWGPLRLAGTLTGGLDAALQPTGTAQLRVEGALAVLEAASRAGLVQPGPASAARAVLGLLTLAAHGGPLLLPVRLQDRTLTVAQFALLRLPALDWDPR